MAPAATNTRKPARGREVVDQRDEPAAFRITAARRAKFLDLVSKGATRSAAAQELGTTGTKFRSLCRNDPAFQLAYEQALEKGLRYRTYELRDALWSAVEDREPWAIRMLAEAHLDEFGYKRARTTHVEMTGHTEVTHVVQLDAVERLRERLAGVVGLDDRRMAALPVASVAG